MKSKISIFYLGVRDFEKSLAFYRDTLGFTTHNYEESEDHVMFELEGSWLGLYPKDKLADDATVQSDDNGFSGFTIAHCVGSEEEVDKLIENLRQQKVPITKEPQRVEWGGYSAYFQDPDGYLWEVAYNPFTDLT